MTNEQIFTIFLKSKRKYSSAKRQKFTGLSGFWIEQLSRENGVEVSHAVNYLFIWERTKEGHSFWEDLELSWSILCKDFNLKGYIDLNKVLS